MSLNLNVLSKTSIDASISTRSCLVPIQGTKTLSMSSASESSDIGDGRVEDREYKRFQRQERRWYPKTPHPDSLPVSPVDQEDFDNIHIRTDFTTTTRTRTYSDQEVQCDLDQKEAEVPPPKVEESYPSNSKLAVLVICTCTAIFLQALVRLTSLPFSGAEK
jgi:hypothetical protein